MSLLPTLTMPGRMPVFLAEGHGIELVPIFADVPTQAGHNRKRRLFTETDRVVPVGLVLDASQMARFDNWFENSLLAGQEPFAARVANQGPGLLWWKARWQAPYTTVPLGRGWWRVTGKLILTGAGQVNGPDTADLSVSFGFTISGTADISSSAALSVSFGVDVRQAVALFVSFGINVLQGGTIISPGVGSITVTGQVPVATNPLDLALDEAYGDEPGSLLRRGTVAWEVILPGPDGYVLTMGPVLPDWEAPSAVVDGSSGGSGDYTFASSPPAGSPGPVPGHRWLDSDTGILYTYVDDGTSFQWVEF